MSETQGAADLSSEMGLFVLLYYLSMIDAQNIVVAIKDAFLRFHKTSLSVL